MSRQPFIDFRHLKANADFKAVLEYYGLTPGRARKGNAVMIRCPFHDDTKPSCAVDLAKKAFHCFGCEAKGNVLEFVADIEQLDRRAGLREAATRLAAICGLPLAAERHPAKGLGTPQERPEDAGARVGSARRPKTPPGGSQSPTGPCLERNEPRPYGLKFVEREHPYLTARGLDAATAEELDVGYYAGKGSMRGRIVFAVHDWWPDPAEPSRLVAFVGRWPGDPVPEGELRWRFPEGFRKSQVLYNLHRIAGAKHVHLVEGLLDAIRLDRQGLAATALMGRSISPEQVELLWRSGARYVTVLMDGDAEGQAGVPAIVTVLAARGLFARAVTLPEGQDPASLDEATLQQLLRREAR
jgi:DNA primase